MLQRIFTWWNGATLGALFDIGRRGVFVGKDEQGNRYYEERRPSLEGRKRRYVIYVGVAEASRVPPDWHAWMHHITAEPPTEAPLKRQKWEQPHLPNLTGTVRAYRPKGSLARGGVRAHASADYEAWTPDDGGGS
jgi:NADH:ubiquinone oxidoreductase subunit